MSDITPVPEQAPADKEIIQLSPQETYMIQTHANIRFAAASRLSEGDNIKIQAMRRAIADLVNEGGDHARVALQLFLMEYDNSKPPFGDAFDQMEMVPWEEAVRMWQEGADANVPGAAVVAQENGQPVQ